MSWKKKNESKNSSPREISPESRIFHPRPWPDPEYEIGVYKLLETSTSYSPDVICKLNYFVVPLARKLIFHSFVIYQLYYCPRFEHTCPTFPYDKHILLCPLDTVSYIWRREVIQRGYGNSSFHIFWKYARHGYAVVILDKSSQNCIFGRPCSGLPATLNRIFGFARCEHSKSSVESVLRNWEKADRVWIFNSSIPNYSACVLSRAGRKESRE